MMNDIATGDLLLKKEKQSFVLTLIVVFVLIAALVFFYFFAFIPIDGESMENTIPNNRQCLVLRKCFDVERGDIVIVDISENNQKSHEIIKRVIAVGGDKLIFMRSADKKTIETYLCKNGSNRFVKLNEPYIKEAMSVNANNFYDIPILDYMPELTTYDLDKLDHQTYSKFDSYINYVQKNRIFFMGDNRNISRDSRYYGTRPLTKVKYKVLTVI